MTYRVAIWDEVPSWLLIALHIIGVGVAVTILAFVGLSALIGASSILVPLVLLRVVLARPYDRNSSLTLDDSWLAVSYRGSKDVLSWMEIRNISESTEPIYPRAFTWPFSIPSRFLIIEAARDIRIRRLPVFGADRLRVTAEYPDELERHIRDRLNVAASTQDTG